MNFLCNKVTRLSCEYAHSFAQHAPVYTHNIILYHCPDVFDSVFGSHINNMKCIKLSLCTKNKTLKQKKIIIKKHTQNENVQKIYKLNFR